MEEAGKKKKQRKPKYGMCSNTLYMLGWGRKAPPVLWTGLLFTLLQVGSSVINLYMAPAILGSIEAHRSFTGLLALMGGFVLALMLCGGLQSYVKTNMQDCRITVRTMIIGEVNQKLGTCSYPLLYDEDFQNRRVKAMEALGNNQSAGEAVWKTLFDILSNTICFLIYLVLLTQVKPFLIVVTILTTGLGHWITYRFVQKDYVFREETMKAYRGGACVYDAVRNPKLAKDIRIFGMKDWLEGMYFRYRKMSEDVQKRRTKNHLTADVAGLGLDFLRNGIAYAYLLTITLQGGLSASEFLLYFTAVTGFTSRITGILDGFTTLHRQSIDISGIREFCETEEPFCMEKGKTFSPDKNTDYCFVFQDVTFRYPNAKKPVLEHFNLKIRPGEKLAVVGMNGAGKTTMIKLLCGFIDPNEGQVLLNGADIREYNRQDYYKLFGAVFQDFFILAGSVAENVAQSTEPDMERVRECLERAGIRERIERFPGSYETKLEKKVHLDAVELSGGELQRLMLARMLYKDAPVTILDEPTAALDALAERDIYERYHDLTKGGTSIYISHRLASTRFCDRVILLGEGGILEEGTHQELMHLGGKYAELFEIQSKYYREGEMKDEA